MAEIETCGGPDIRRMSRNEYSVILGTYVCIYEYIAQNFLLREKFGLASSNDQTSTYQFLVQH